MNNPNADTHQDITEMPEYERHIQAMQLKQQASLFSIDPHAPEELKNISPQEPKKRGPKFQKRLNAVTDVLSSPPEQSDLTFLLTIFANCFFPRNPTDKRTYTQKGGNYGLLIHGGAATDPRTGELIEQPIPFGGAARQFISFLNHQAISKETDTIFLGNNLAEAIERITGQAPTGGAKGNIRRWKQMFMAFGTCSMAIEDLRSKESYAQKKFNVIDEFRVWFPPENTPDQSTLFPTTIKLHADYMNLLKNQKSFPCDLRVLTQLADATLAFDIYVWLCYRLPNITEPVSISWPYLKKQFGQDYKGLAQFKFWFKKSLDTALSFYPDAKVKVEKNAFVLCPSKSAVPDRRQFTLR